MDSSNNSANAAPVIPAFDFDANAELENRIMECENQIHKLKENKVEEETFDIRAFSIEERIDKLEKAAAQKVRKQLSKKESLKFGFDPAILDGVNNKIEALEKSNVDLHREVLHIETLRTHISDLQKKTMKIVTED